MVSPVKPPVIPAAPVKQFISLSDRNAVRADTIVRVYVQSDYLMVQTEDGEIHQADGLYGRTVWDAKSQLLEQIEAALAAQVTAPASDKATNALTRSNSLFAGEFKTWLKTLIDNDRFDELKRALDCAHNSFSRC